MGGDEGPLSTGSKSKREKEGYCVLHIRRKRRNFRGMISRQRRLRLCLLFYDSGRTRP